jgi:AcrR family transcriptional regulator
MATDSIVLLSRAFGPQAEPVADAASERILDAALALAAASGVRHLTMDDVARRAGVGRMTVYRRFGDKQGMLEALAARESRRCLAELDEAIDPAAPVAEQVAEGFVASMRIARRHPLLVRLARFEPATVVESLTADGGAIFAAMRDFVATRLRAAQDAGALAGIEEEEAAELLVRLCVSFVLIEDTVLPLDDEDRSRELARRLLAPILAG